jgi:choline dehydrogenase
MVDLRDTYDFIVIGSGSAGAPVVRRLVDAGASVLLLEAGGPDTNPSIHDPAGLFDLWHVQEDWDFHTEPQAGLAGRRLYWPRGKVLGGSSSLNGMAFIRGNPLDFDLWAYQGNPGWSYKDVLPLFRRMEDADIGASRFHGAGGPLRVTHEYEPHPANAAFVEAGTQLGFPHNPDFNGETQDGVGHFPLTVRDGRRESTAAAYLRPAPHAERLTVRTGAHAHRLLFEGTRCVGVAYRDADGTREARADAEVIVCAGAIGSPQLLMLSGIGDAGQLRAHGIGVRVHAPGVGADLHDHVLVPVIYGSSRPVPGPMPGVTPLHSTLFAHSAPGLPVPDLQPVMFHLPLYDPEWMSGPGDAVTLAAGIVRPTSRGGLRLASADPEAAPLMDPRYLSTPGDMAAMRAAVDVCRRLAATPALKEWAAAELYPGPGVRTEAELTEYIRRAAITYHHQAGTCRMGVDDGAVVDPALRVHGVDGLRVADASVMPTVTTGNTNAPAIMIGEKCADLVLAAHGLPAVAGRVIPQALPTP